MTLRQKKDRKKKGLSEKLRIFLQASHPSAPQTAMEEFADPPLRGQSLNFNK